MQIARALVVFFLSGFTQVAVSSDSDIEGTKRIFCESDDSALPYVKFDFYPLSDSNSEGSILLSIDKGTVLDISSYNNASLTIGTEQVTIDYSDGRLLFNVAGDFEHEGSLKHFLSGGILKAKVTCYYLAGE
jgi:hypothetical protein